MLERPISRVYAIFSIENPVIDVQMIIFSIEENLNRPALMTGDEVKMGIFCQFIYLKDTPDRVIEADQRLGSEKTYGLLQDIIWTVFYGQLELTVYIFTLLNIINGNKFVVFYQFFRQDRFCRGLLIERFDISDL